MTRPAIRALRFTERALIGVGLALCMAWVAARLHGEIGRRVGLAQFEEARSRAAAATPSSSASVVDDRLWSEKRVQAYKESLGRAFPAPLAVLKIPRAHVEVPVLPGTDEATLNRAVGWIQSTARPGEKGNVGIAGHRDGFFRGLKDVANGDVLMLETARGREEYVVDDIRIVSPQEVSVLQATPSPAVTLVTCYPFYFVGDAPRRYIVRAVRRGPKAEKASLPR
jgi:sortase A